MAEEIEKILSAVAEGLVEGLEADRKESLHLEAEAHKAEALFLKEEKTRLEKILGPDHPGVLELEDAAIEAGFLESVNRNVLKRIEKRHRVGSDEWTINGEVIDPSGKPMTDVIVTIADAEGKYANILGTTTTDDDGEFSRVYSVKEHPVLFEAQPEVFITVSDAQGRSLYKSTEPVKVGAGAMALFDIQIKKSRGAARPSPERPRPPTEAEKGREKKGKTKGEK